MTTPTDLAQALREIIDADMQPVCCNRPERHPDTGEPLGCCGSPEPEPGPCAQIAMTALAAHESRAQPERPTVEQAMHDVAKRIYASSLPDDHVRIEIADSIVRALRLPRDEYPCAYEQTDEPGAQPASVPAGWIIEELDGGFVHVESPQTLAVNLGYCPEGNATASQLLRLLACALLESQSAQPASVAGWGLVPEKMTTEIEDEMARVWNHGPHAVLAAVHRGARKALAAAPQPAKESDHGN